MIQARKETWKRTNVGKPDCFRTRSLNEDVKVAAENKTLGNAFINSFPVMHKNTLTLLSSYQYFYFMWLEKYSCSEGGITDASNNCRVNV